MTYDTKGQSIKFWAEDDRPREKFQSKGRQALSNAEILAILIGSGTRQQSAVELCREMLAASRNKLGDLAKSSVEKLTQVRGIGPAKAITVLAALELGRRLKTETVTKDVQISCSNDAYQVIGPVLEDLSHEEFHVLLLNRANIVIKTVRISSGGISGTVVDGRLIFKPAIEMLASGVILCHNHPSGKIRPSQSDISLTKKMKDAGKLVDVNVLDHLIIGKRQYYSFADEGLL
ncbi:MAG: DNA repair protein RadC [Saprospiraceae bacterium]|nr:DNA repair protein RadC [Saprospiraceae bacterium]